MLLGTELNSKGSKVAAKTIELSQPIKGHRGPVTKITLREPRYRDLMDLGMPSTWVAVPGGGGFEQESFTALEEWVNRLVVDMDVNFLELLSLKDSLALRAAVRDFFFDAAGVTELKPSTDLPEASPSSAEPTSRRSII
jgi:hypothetical protein